MVGVSHRSPEGVQLNQRVLYFTFTKEIGKFLYKYFAPIHLNISCMNEWWIFVYVSNPHAVIERQLNVQLSFNYYMNISCTQIFYTPSYSRVNWNKKE